MNKLEIVNQTTIKQAIPVGDPPDLKTFENEKIYPIGRLAQWDYFMNLGSCLRRISRLSNEAAL